MKKLIIAVAMVAFYGCGSNEPSLSEIERGMKESFIRETGNFAVGLKARAKKIGDGRWSVKMTVGRNGESRTLNATAVMNRSGDIHYYTD